MVPRVVFNIGDWGDFVSLVQVICTPIAKQSMEGIFMAKITKSAKVPSKSTKAEMVDKVAGKEKTVIKKDCGQEG